MISKLSIEGFKGFERLDIPSLSRITLLGGHNNVGKTSILEALFLFHDRLNPQIFLRLFAWRGVGSIAFEPDSIWAPIFYNYDMDKKIEISAMINGIEEKMSLTFNPHYVPVVIPAKNMRPGFRPTQISTDQKVEPSFSLDIVYNSQKMKNQKIHLVIGLDGVGIQIDNTVIESRKATLLGARTAINPKEDAQKFGQLDILGKQDNIVEFLKIIEPNLKSLSSVSMGDASLIHGDIGLKRKIPVAYMGDGVSRLLSIILAIATTRNGIVMIDECENGVHYSVMPKIWEAIAKAAREYNCQVICTTHSYECLEAAIKGLSGELASDFSYIRIDRSNNKNVAKSFDHGMLKLAIDTNMEVR